MESAGKDRSENCVYWVRCRFKDAAYLGWCAFRSFGFLSPGDHAIPRHRPSNKVRWGAGFPQSSSGWLARSASLPLLGGSSSSSLFFHSFYAKGLFIFLLCMQDVLGSHKIIYENKALLVQFGRTRVSKTRCRRFKSYRAWFHSC